MLDGMKEGDWIRGYKRHTPLDSAIEIAADMAHIGQWLVLLLQCRITPQHLGLVAHQRMPGACRLAQPTGGMAPPLMDENSAPGPGFRWRPAG